MTTVTEHVSNELGQDLRNTLYRYAVNNLAGASGIRVCWMRNRNQITLDDCLLTFYLLAVWQCVIIILCPGMILN